MYQVLVKSHTDVPDFEAEYSEEELEGRCLIPYADDEYMIGASCGGKLEKTKEGFKCKSCKEKYIDKDLAEAIYDNALEAEATGN